MDGILNINKPAGITSFGVVAFVKKLSREKRVGHAGTLDPLATGVLPVCLGQGTRIIEFLADDDKRYRAEVELGVSTETYDSEGTVLRRIDPAGVTREQLDAALTSFRGTIQQVPPMYSALKHQGRPLYDLARSGITVDVASRSVTIHSLDVIEFQSPVVTLDLVCSKGTYIRSIAHDLGQALGCGAYLKGLVRTRCGIFDIKDSFSLAQLEDATREARLEQLLLPIDSVLQNLTAVTVDENQATDIRNGRPVALASAESEGANRVTGGIVSEKSSFGDCCRAYAGNGGFVAVLRFNREDGLWHPHKVFHGSAPHTEPSR